MCLIQSFGIILKMTNDQCQMSNEAQNPNDQMNKKGKKLKKLVILFGFGDFGFNLSLGF